MSRVYVDTNILILAFEGGDQRALDVVELLNAFEARPGTLVTSELTLAEIGAQDEEADNWLSVCLSSVPSSTSFP